MRVAITINDEPIWSAVITNQGPVDSLDGRTDLRKYSWVDSDGHLGQILHHRLDGAKALAIEVMLVAQARCDTSDQHTPL